MLPVMESSAEKRKQDWSHWRRKSVAGDMIDVMQLNRRSQSPSPSLGSTLSLRHADSASDLTLPSIPESYASKIKQRRASQMKSVETKIKKSPSDGDLTRASSAASSVSMLDANHRLLQRYQGAMTKHLEKLSIQLNEEMRTLEEKLKRKREANRLSAAEFHQIHYKHRREGESLGDKTDKLFQTTEKKGKMLKLVDNYKNELDKTQRSLAWVEMQEKYWQQELDKTDKKISKIREQDTMQQQTLKTLKNTAEKAQKELSGVEKGKKLQDHTIAQIKEGITETEQELQLVMEDLEATLLADGDINEETARSLTKRSLSDTEMALDVAVEKSKTKLQRLQENKGALDKDAANLKGEVEKLKVDIRKGHDEISRLNSFLLKKTQTTKTLEEQQAALQDRIKERTKEAENECKVVNDRLKQLATENQQLTKKIEQNRAETQTLAEKVSANEEAQALVSDQSNQDELNKLVAEIRRKKMQLQELTNKQMEALAKEVEMEVRKRDKLLDRDHAEIMGRTNRPTRVELNDRLEELRKHVRQWQRDLGESKRELEQTQFDFDEISSKMGGKEEKMHRKHNKIEDLATEQKDLLDRHFKNEYRLQAKQLVQKTLTGGQSSLKRQTAKFAHEHERLLKAVKEKRKELQTTASNLSTKEPETQQAMTRVHSLLA